MKTDSETPKVAHTPTPWTLLDPWTTGDTVKQQLVSQGRGAMMLQHDGTKEGRANAAFIVQAVNSHQALIEACEYAKAVLGAIPAFGDHLGPAINKPMLGMARNKLTDALHLAKREAHL